MQRTRVAMVGVPRLLGEILERLLAAQPDIEIVGVTSFDADGLPIPPLEADAFVVANGEGDLERRACELLRRYPSARVVAVAADARSGSLHELRPCRTFLGELSPEGLIAALRAGATEI
jgi:hypothetical protein